MAECIHGLDEEWCATCKHGPERPARAEVEATFAARFDGECPSCGFPICTGQVIHRLTNERYVHQGCE